MLDILCIGDSVIDIFLRMSPNDPKFGIDKEKNKLVINFGDKLTVEKYVIGLGGNATNTAVGASRLGLKTGLMAETGNDEFAQKIINTLKKENINSQYVIFDTNKQTSVTIALSYDGERTLFTEYIERKHEFNFDSIQAKMIYLTSLGNAWQHVYEKTLNLISQNHNLLAFNPGTVQLEHKNKTVIDVIEKTDFLFVNKEEAEEILYGKELEVDGLDNKELIKKLLFGLKALGARNIIITDSINGSYLQTADNKTYHLEIVKVNVVEKTGAGDSYTAGFLSAVIKGLSLQEAMIWGAINSSNTIQHIGSQNGVLTQEKLNEIKNSLTNFSPQEI
jgi:sugar/nucleoside kinase (ribokinase family)